MCCNICLNDGIFIGVCENGHQFHVKCIQDYLSSKLKSSIKKNGCPFHIPITCPTCRENLNVRIDTSISGQYKFDIDGYPIGSIKIDINPTNSSKYIMLCNRYDKFETAYIINGNKVFEYIRRPSI